VATSGSSLPLGVLGFERSLIAVNAALSEFRDAVKFHTLCARIAHADHTAISGVLAQCGFRRRHQCMGAGGTVVNDRMGITLILSPPYSTTGYPISPFRVGWASRSISNRQNLSPCGCGVPISRYAITVVSGGNLWWLARELCCHWANDGFRFVRVRVRTHNQNKTVARYQ